MLLYRSRFSFLSLQIFISHPFSPVAISKETKQKKKKQAEERTNANQMTHLLFGWKIDVSCYQSTLLAHIFNERHLLCVIEYRTYVFGKYE